MVDLTETHFENREWVQPHHANVLQTAHGGHVLRWMDELGAMSATRFAGEPCVTAHIDQVNFERPIEVGDVALLESYVYDAGRTSVRVRLRVYREDVRTGAVERTTESYFVYVAIDGDRRPTPVPALETPTERERRLREEALTGAGGDPTRR